jgi:RNA polymerase sigma-70 factor, ECF subfamily
MDHVPPGQRDHSADLLLARACASGEAAALITLDAMLVAETAAAGASVRAPADVGKEALQRLRFRLLVDGGDGAPAIADYAGRGDLRGYLRICATRECLGLMQSQRRELGMDAEDLGRLAAAADPELDRLKASYRREFEACFTEALARLAPPERTLLRYQVIDRLGIDQIGAIYGIHRATAASNGRAHA